MGGDVGAFVFQGLGALGGIGALATLILVAPNIKKLRAEAHQTEVDAAVSEGAADDEHFRTMIATQTEFVVAPLREEVARQGVRIGELEAQVKSIRRLYRMAVDTLRAFVQYSLVLVGLLPPGTTPPPPPAIPNDIAEDF